MTKGVTFFLDQGETLGGAERFLVDFLDHLSATELRQLRPVLVGGKLKSYREKLPEQIEVQRFDYPSVRGNKIIAIFKLLFAAWKLKKLTQEKNAWRVFSNTPRTHFVAYLAKKFWRMKQPWVMMMHDFTTPQFLLKKMARVSTVIVVNGIPSREDTRAKISSRDHKKMKIVENGLDFEALPEAQPAKQLQKILILGRLDPRKGQIFALEAMDLLAERNPDLMLEVIGSSFPGDPRTVEYEAQLHAFAKQRALSNVKFIAEVDNPFDAMAKADLILVLPTEPETFGRVTTEALSMGKLVLAFDRTGPREILQQFERFVVNKTQETLPCSLRIPCDNAMSLAETIGYLADHSEEIQVFTPYARPFVQKAYPLSETKKRLVNILLDA